MPVLSAALSGAGPVLLPDGPGDLRGPDGPALGPGENDAEDPTVALLSTSGSSGRSKRVLLQASALLASASATHDRLGGPGRWLLALPVHHVAGLQVLVRSLVTGTTPVAVDLAGGFRPAEFVEAAGRLGRARRYTALVPTQLGRLLDAGDEAAATLAGFDAVLVGGAATPDPLLRRAREAGVRIVTSYGMTETCGGCVYDGLPLQGVTLTLDDDGRISLGGPVVARGYHRADGAAADGSAPGTPFTIDATGRRWFRTDDAGTTDGERLVVLGRLDDLIVTGGLKVAPRAVEAVLLDLPEIAEAIVLGVPDAEWGQRVVAAVVLAPGATAPTLAGLRGQVAARLGRAAAPRQCLVLDSIPLLGPGKPDRTRLAALAADGGA
ncbi:MAG: AMP-binding protein [Actinomycetales bacterium]|nr:AMP-binding protein [Actinomycetales bacterium]